MAGRDSLKRAAKDDAGQGTDLGGGYGKSIADVINTLDKPTEFKKTFFKLVKSFSPYKYLFLLAAVFSAASTVFVVFAPKLMADIVNMLVNGVTKMVYEGAGAGLRDPSYKEGIYGMLLLILSFYILGGGFLYAQSYITATVAQRVALKMRGDINLKISRLPAGYFDRHSYGDILSRITNDVDTVSNALNSNLSAIVRSVSTVLGMTVMMFTMNVPLTFAVLISLPLSFIIVRIIAKRSQNYFRERQNYLGAVNGCIEESYGGHAVVKAFGLEERNERKFGVFNEKLFDIGWKSQAVSGLIYPLIVFVGNLAYVAVIVLGAYLAIADPTGTTLGLMYAFVQYVKEFTIPINQIAQISNVLQSTVAAAERIYAFLDNEEERKEDKPEKLPEYGGIKGGVVFENVTFGYDENLPVLKNLSFDIKPGSRVAIVGQTGSGKTTIVKLLMRFYDADGGRILLDGTDISLYDKSEYRRLVSMVLQDIWLFNGTIRENIRYGRLDATDDEVKAAAVMAGADKFITSLKDGYDAVINEETSNFSEGEKQLLSVARAVVRRSRIVILDEATSSVDTLTERIVQDALDKITKDKTCFIIAHRLSTIVNADLILVMRDGELTESGSHGELLKKNGIYAAMYDTQFAK
ncbi:MAG: ABC transporter ATP-binding protein/permease [Clostridiales bacterium]|jgi:ATP-binding cassette subfamily B protein|nr:ABC transporter ATP-binding protein/permease [Clostridiales bacterium]